MASARCSEEAIWWLERPRAAEKQDLKLPGAERRSRSPRSVPSSIERGIPTTAFFARRVEDGRRPDGRHQVL